MNTEGSDTRSRLQWHMSGPHFRDCHLLLDERAEQVFAMTGEIWNL